MNHPYIRLLRVGAVCVACLPVVHFFGFLYGEILAANHTQSLLTFQSVVASYIVEIQLLYQGESRIPGSETGFIPGMYDAFVRSLGLYLGAASIALLGGLWSGLSIIRRHRGRLPAWFSTIMSTSAALPALFFASGSIALLYYILIYTTYDLPFPLQGFGWDSHLVVPLIALCLRSLCSISVQTALSLNDEYSKPHIVAIRAKGVHEAQLLHHHVWPAQQQSIIAGSVHELRLMLAELIVVEYLFRWQGIGHHFANAVIAPRMSSIEASSFYASSSVISACLVGFLILYACGECLRAIAIPRHEHDITLAESA